MKITMQVIRNLFRPKKRPNHPVAGKDNRVRDKITGQDPGGLISAGRQVTGDVIQRHVGNRGIQNLHERRQHHRESDEPGIDDWFITLQRCLRHRSSCHKSSAKINPQSGHPQAAAYAVILDAG